MDIQEAVDRCAERGVNYFLRGVVEIPPTLELKPGVRIRRDRTERGIWVEPEPESAISELDLELLKQIASDATQGEWRVRIGDVIRVSLKDGSSICGCHKKANDAEVAVKNARHIAKFGPLAALNLVWRAERLEAILKAIRALEGADAAMSRDVSSFDEEAERMAAYDAAYSNLILLADGVEFGTPALAETPPDLSPT